MDVQMENTDPPPGESQPSGKIRKGFKLFGKRKPGNIFSIRSKGDGNNKSPVIRSRTMDGLSDTPAQDSEQEADKENGQEVSQGDSEHAEEEPLSDDGILAAAPARTSISSASSAKSLSFLSLLRGGRRGVGDRRVQTVSQPVGRQRRGLKGLFGSVKFRSKDKDDRKDVPPSPLLKSSRANSVEIIKEDLTLTPKSQPRSLDSPETETSEPLKTLTAEDSAATSPSKTPPVTTRDVTKTTEHVTPLSTPEPPLVPGDTSLSSLLADISSLLTFDSITGGDIMADVEAEWGKASSTSSAVVTEVTPLSTSLFSKPTAPPQPTSTFVSTAVPVKPSPVATLTAASTQPLTPLTKTSSTSSPISKPSSIITTFTKSSTLTTQSVKLSSDSPPASELTTNIKISSTPAPAAIKPSNAPATFTSFSPPATLSSSVNIKYVQSTTSSSATALLTTPSTGVKASSVSPVLTATTTKLATETAVPPKINASVSKLSSVVTSSSSSEKPAPVTHTPPIYSTPIQPPPDKLDLASSFNLQTSTSDKSRSAAGADVVTVTSACAITTKPSSPALASVSKMTTLSTSATVSGSVSVTTSKAIATSSPMDLNKTSSSRVSEVTPSSAVPVTSKAPSGSASLPISSSTSLDKTPLTPKPTSMPSSDKIPPAPEPVTAPTTQAAMSSASLTPAAVSQVPVAQTKSPAVSTPIPISVPKDLPDSAQIQITHPKPSPSPAQVPVSVTKDQTASVQMQVSQPSTPLPPVEIPVSVLKAHPFTAITPAATDTPASISVPISVSKDIPAPAQIPVAQSKAPLAPVTMPCPVTSISTPAPGPATPNSTSAYGGQSPPLKTEQQPNEAQRNLHGPSKDKKTAQQRPSGLSKIPVVGGGRVGKLPVRDSQHADEESIRDPPTPVLEEEKPHFNSHDAGSKVRNSAVETKSPPSKHSPEESSQQPKGSSSSGRDSKIPVKHSVQSHTASQIPQSKEPPRTKIPVSKVPVRRVANKPASAGSTQIRK